MWQYGYARVAQVLITSFASVFPVLKHGAIQGMKAP
jgi:hypothetical protein